MADGVGAGALLRSLLFASDHPVTIDVDANGEYHVRCGRVICAASTLTESLRQALVWVDGGEAMTAAKNRTRVRLPEGGLGVLVRVTSRSRVATVRTDEGRWRHLPVGSLELMGDAT